MIDNVMSEVKAKNIYEVGEIPQLGQVPDKMYAWTIRRERHGVPEKSFQIEQVAVSYTHLRAHET